MTRKAFWVMLLVATMLGSICHGFRVVASTKMLHLRQQAAAKFIPSSPTFNDIFKSLTYANPPLSSSIYHRFHLLGKRLLRKKAATPHPKDEAWRFTNLSNLFDHINCSQSVDDKNANIEFCDIENYIDPACRRSVLVVVNGVFSQQLSRFDNQLVEMMNIIPSLNQSHSISRGTKARLSKYFAMYSHNTGDFHELSRDQYGSFSLLGLNAVNIDDWMVLHVEANSTPTVPIQILHVSTCEEEVGLNTSAFHRTLLILEQGATLDLKQSFISIPIRNFKMSKDERVPHHKFASTNITSSFMNSVTQIILKNESSFKHTYFQNMSANDRHTEVILADVQTSSCYNATIVLAGAKISRVNMHTIINGQHANVSVFGLILADKYQSLDLHSSVEHNASSTRSNQIHHNLVGDKGLAIFKGRMRIPAIGQKTISDQQCRTILFGDTPRVIVMPTQEVAAEDVVCSHGAAISDVNQDSLWYMESRGIRRKEARTLLLEMFMNDMLINSNMDTTSRQYLSAKLHAMNPLDEYDPEYADLFLGRAVFEKVPENLN